MKHIFNKQQTDKFLSFGSFVTFIAFAVSFLAGRSVFAQNQKPTEVLTRISEDTYMLKDMEINTSKKTVTIPCTINMATGLIEVVLCRPEGKTHESLLTTKISALEFQTALILLGLDPVNELPDDSTKRDPLSPYKTIETPGDSVLMFVEIEKEGKLIREPIESFLRDERTKTAVKRCTWLFKGAVTHKSNHLLVDPNVTIISTYFDPVALMEINSSAKYNDELFYANEAAGLVKGQQVKLVIQSLNN